jgi:hypothetical protein
MLILAGALFLYPSAQSKLLFYVAIRDSAVAFALMERP